MGGNVCKCLKSQDSSNLLLKESVQNSSINSISPFEGYKRYYTENLRRIVKIQSYFKGILSRRKISLIQNQSSLHSSTVKQNWSSTSESQVYSNKTVSEVEVKLGLFDYSKYHFIQDGPIIKKPCMKSEYEVIYKGEWNLLNKREGKGIQIWKDGSKYEGYWKNDMANGYGRMIHSDGDSYEGEWLNDLHNGYGIYYNADGSSFQGYWRKDKQHGKGKEICTDGSTYEGDYKLGMKWGKGLFKWNDGSQYEGDLIENDIDGFGKYLWTDGRQYIGNWKKNKMNGHGIFQWPDGRKYIGEYLNDKKHGKGEFFWPDGTIFKGEWVNGEIVE